MALSYRRRKALAMLILVIGMPIYVIAAVNLVDLAREQWGRQQIWLEFVIFVGLGLLWIMPMKSLFNGIGQADPDAKSADDPPQE